MDGPLKPPSLGPGRPDASGAARAQPWIPPLPLPAWAGYALFSVGYFLLGRAGYLLLDPATHVAVWWPPNGLYLAALLLVPRRRWPLVVLAALPAAVAGSLLRGRSLDLALWFFAGNSAGTLLGAWLVQRHAGPRPSVSTVRGAFAVTALPAAAAALVSVVTAALRSFSGGNPFSVASAVFWGGSSLGVLIVAPALLAWTEPREAGTRRWPRIAEGAAVAAALGLAFLAVSGRLGPIWTHEYVLVPPLIWAAFRLGPRGATAALVASAAVAVWTTAARGTASAIGARPLDSVLALQLFLAVLVTTVLFLAAASAERRRAALELARSRDLLGSFFASSPTGMFIKDDRHRAVVMSPILAALIGRPAEELVGRTAAETVPGPVGEALLEMERRVAATGRVVREEVRFEDRTLLDVTFPIPRSEGAPYIGGFAVDVTDRVHAERALRESEARLRLVEAAVERSSDAMSVQDEEGRIVWVNAAAARALGHPKERLLGTMLFDVLPAVTPADWARRWEATARGGALVIEEPIPGPGGRPVPGEIAAAIVEHDGRRYYVSSARDVSDRRRAEAAARLAGVGTLAAGVAHEINNPLAYVLGNLAWIREQLERMRAEGPTATTGPAARLDEMVAVLADAEDGAVRVRDIVRDLRLFARAKEGIGPVDAGAAARSALAIAQNEIRHRARLATRFDATPPVLANEGRLAQVFLNLLTNAAQAIREGHAAENEIRVEVRARDGEVVAEVSDSGSGMTPAVRARIFEPFFTTKPVGTGTGLGLFVCHGIVADMGGRLEVETEPGRGSTFRVILPAAPPRPADAALPAPDASGDRARTGPVAALPASDASGVRVQPGAASPAEASPAPGRRARVLVLDDDGRVADALRRMLEPEHQVEVLTRSRQALERVRAGASWDAVLCDVMMPELSGIEWFEEVRRVDPALARRVVFVTGGAFTAAARTFLEEVENPRIEKPFVAAEVRAAVAGRMATPGAA
jgi:PAS domain S-box-containing protein